MRASQFMLEQGFFVIFSFLIFMSYTAPIYANSRRQPVSRRGVMMGLDPGLALRFNDFGMPLYARLSIRLAGCVNKHIQIGADYRMDILVTGDEDAPLTRHEIGPVVTFFVYKGWFLRPFGHIAGVSPFLLTAGMSTGYEWSMGRFSGAGILIGGDTDIRFDGEQPEGYSIFFSVYLSAYDLGTRRGRNDMDL